MKTIAHSCRMLVSIVLAVPVLLCTISTSVLAAAPQPLVAVHISELTQALETMPAVSPTPTGSGTTGYQWWYATWRYFVAAESLKEILASDGTPYVTVSDADISAGKLRNSDGTPRYPILISLAAEAIDDSQVAPLRDYVNAGGFLVVGSSSFTRKPDGSQRGNFALATEMGIKMTYSSPGSSNDWNWYGNTRFTRVTSHRLTTSLPSDTLVWGAPFSAAEIPWGVSPQHPVHQMHLAWRVTGTGATVLANSIVGPLWTVNPYGAGQILFNGQFQPLIGHGASDPTMYSYLFFRRAIEWAFEAFKLPLLRVSPWRYPYDAAFMVRHDFENSQTSIRLIETSAQFENSLGAKGDYYFCTGTLRDEMGGEAATVTGLRNAVSKYGATIGSHNGGLKNPVNSGLVQSDYDYWHWGPDEALDVTPAGYASGTAYANTSILKSFTDIEGWLSGLDNGRSGCGVLKNCPRTWASPYFNATREGSRNIMHQLGLVATAGEQKLGPFPARTLSYTTADKRFSPVSLPVSDWFVGVLIAQSTEGHTISSIRAGIDFYYALGALINIYGHQPSNNGAVQQEYVTYGMAKPRIWSSNAVGVSDWWRLRAAVTVTPSVTTTSDSYVISATVSGATDPDTAIELAIPSGYSGSPLVYLNGQPAAVTEYRATSSGVKIRVGSSVTLVRVQNTVNQAPVAASDSYSTNQNVTLTVAAPGVLANDSDPEGSTLTAQLVAGPSHGTLTLNSNGSFTYIPTTGYSGSDSFTYKASDGTLTSSSATVSITVKANQAPVATNDSYSTNQNTTLTVTAPGVLANDSDPEGSALTAQKVSNPSHGTVTLNSNGSFTYTPTTGYSGSDSFTYRASDGTLTSSTVTVSITVKANQAPVAVSDSYSTNQNTALNVAAPGVLTNDSDPEGSTLTAQLVTGPSHGSLTLSSNGSFTYTPATGYSGSDSFTYKASDGSLTSSTATVTLTVIPVNQAPVAVNDSYSTNQNTALNVTAPGVLTNDSDPEGSTLTAQLVTGPSHGSLTLNSNGSFTYTPTAGYSGSDGFTYKASDGLLTSSTATVTLTVIAVNQAPVATNDSYSTNQNTALTVAVPGVLTNDSDPEGSTLTAQLVTGPSHGTLTLNSNGSFTYTPTTGYSGSDSFTYKASDGSLTSGSATVAITVLPVSSSLFSDDFTRASGQTNPLLPWTVQSGTWSIDSSGVLRGSGATMNYSCLYTVPDPEWRNYSVEAQFQFPAGAFGGGIGGKLNPGNGEHYGAWIYPDGSIGGSNTLKLVKFRSWTSWSGTPMGQVNLSSVGTGWHTLKLVFSDTRIQVYYDGVLKIDVTDNNFDSRAPFGTGGISAENWIYTGSYSMGVDNVTVSATQ